MTETEKFKIEYANAMSAFEMVVFSLQHSIGMVLQANGLKNTKINQIVVAHLTADPLKKLFYSLLQCMIEPKSEINQFAKKAHKLITELIEERNILAHTTFWGSHDSDVENYGLRTNLYRHSKSGVKQVSENYTATKFVQFSEKCKLTGGLVTRITITALSINDLSSDIKIELEKIETSRSRLD